MKHLTRICTIALLHQYQHEIKTVTHNGKQPKYIEVTLESIGTASRLAHKILGRTLVSYRHKHAVLLMLLNDMPDGITFCRLQSCSFSDRK